MECLMNKKWKTYFWHILFLLFTVVNSENMDVSKWFSFFFTECGNSRNGCYVYYVRGHHNGMYTYFSTYNVNKYTPRFVQDLENLENQLNLLLKSVKRRIIRNIWISESQGKVREFWFSQSFSWYTLYLQSDWFNCPPNFFICDLETWFICLAACIRLKEVVLFWWLSCFFFSVVCM